MSITNINALRGKIVSAGLYQKDVAKALGINEHSMSEKIKNQRFTLKETEIMIDLLSLTDPNEIVQIFLSNSQ